MSAPYTAVAVANYFVQRGLEEGVYISPMKIQKLTYISHGYYLALSGGSPLIREDVGAWPFGPVIASVYKVFSKYAKTSITELGATKQGDVPQIENSDEDVKAFLNKIWVHYKKATAVQLSNLTHQRGTPWFETYEEKKSKTIDESLIHQHYKDLISSS